MGESSKRDAAPGGLALIEALVNTLDLEQGSDAIGDAALLGRWLRSQGIGSGAPALESERQRLIAIREGLRSLLDGNRGAPVGSTALGRMNDAFGRAGLTVRLDPQGASLDADGAVDRLVARIAEAVLAAQSDGTWRRLKTCRDPECRWAFYDRSRNRSSVWCDMAACGSRTKVRAYRERQAGLATEIDRRSPSHSA